jgi:glycosyltransferase involved in cell wall biosynthesis
VGPFEKELDPLNVNIEKQIFSEPSIKWVDYQADVRPYLSITNVFVFPSYREGFPNVLMQAGSMGVPCIATDINGCNEIIQDHVNGMIIPAKSRLALVKTMKLLYEDSKLLAKMAACTRDIIKENFESTYVMNELLNEYHQQLGVFETSDLSLKLQDND